MGGVDRDCPEGVALGNGPRDQVAVEELDGPGVILDDREFNQQRGDVLLMSAEAVEQFDRPVRKPSRRAT